MSIEINYTNKSSSKSSSNLVLFSNDKFSLNGLKIILLKPRIFVHWRFIKNE